MAGQTDFITLLIDPERLQRMLFACPDGVLATKDGAIAVFGGASGAMFGYQPVEMVPCGDAQAHLRFRQELDARYARHTGGDGRNHGRSGRGLMVSAFQPICVSEDSV